MIQQGKNIIESIDELNRKKDLMKYYFSLCISILFLLDIIDISILLLKNQNIYFNKCNKKEFEILTVIFWLIKSLTHLLCIIIPSIIINEKYEELYYQLFNKFYKKSYDKSSMFSFLFKKKENNSLSLIEITDMDKETPSFNDLLLLMLLKDDKSTFKILFISMNWKVFFRSVSIIITIYGITSSYSKCIE